MMKQTILLIIFFFLFSSCYESENQLTLNTVSKSKKEINNKTANNTNENDDSEKPDPIQKNNVNEYVYLFFDKRVIFPPKKTVTKPVIIQNIPSVSASDYRVIIDWQVEGGRKLKIKNNKTGEIFVINDSDKTGKIVLVERTLFHYKFKIKNQIIKVMR